MNMTERPSRLLNAVRRVLKPLIHLLLRHQVTYAALMPVIKELYIEIADEHFPIDGKRQTESRLSLLTGINRKEVKRLRQLVAEESRQPGFTPSLGGQLVASWLSTPGYHEDGLPLPIPRFSSDVGDVSFETLVETVGRQDIRPRAVLDEWLSSGTAQLRDDGCVELTRDAYVPGKDDDDSLFYFQRNLTDHIATSAHNLNGDGEPRLERSVYYSRLSEEAVQELHAWYREEAMQLLKRMNQKARLLKQRSPGQLRMNAGVYFAQEVLPPAPDTDPTESGESS